MALCYCTECLPNFTVALTIAVGLYDWSATDICREHGVSCHGWYNEHYKHIRAFLKVNKFFKGPRFIAFVSDGLCRSGKIVYRVGLWNGMLFTQRLLIIVHKLSPLTIYLITVGLIIGLHLLPVPTVNLQVISARSAVSRFCVNRDLSFCRFTESITDCPLSPT
jgi:hypothetical protein